MLPQGASITGFALAGVARTALASANEHRSPHDLTIQDLETLCWFHLNVDDVQDAAPGDPDGVREMLARLGYEQFGAQFSPMEEVARSLVLFEDYPDSGLPSPSAWRSAFGATVRDLVNIGFVAYTAAMVHEGSVPIAHMGDDRFESAYGELEPEAALRVLDSFYSSGIEDAANWARSHERPGYEKWSPSPLQDKPVLILGDGTRIVPWPRLIVNKFSPSGLFYPAIEAFGDSFAHSLGQAFESYVGSQLGLLQHAIASGERTYTGKNGEQKTCDWLVVTDECVLLVEAKATRPNVAVRLGTAAGYDDIARKIGKATDQLESSAELIRSGHPVVDDIPNDRPILGLVVTLEPFHFVDALFYSEIFSGRNLPVGMACSHVVEGVVTALAGRIDLGERLRRAFVWEDDAGAAGVPRLWRAAEGLDRGHNPILSSAWKRIGPERDD